jgi:hypothetical protein
MERVWAVPRLCELYPGICLTTKEKYVIFVKTTTVLVSQSMMNITCIDVRYTCMLSSR